MTLGLSFLFLLVPWGVETDFQGDVLTIVCSRMNELILALSETETVSD